MVQMTSTGDNAGEDLALVFLRSFSVENEEPYRGKGASTGSTCSAQKWRHRKQRKPMVRRAPRTPKN